MRKFCSILCLILLCAISTLANLHADQEWLRIETDDKEFSIEIPKNMSVVRDFYVSDSNPDKLGDYIIYSNTIHIGGYMNRTTMFVEVYESKKSMQGMEFKVKSQMKSNASISPFEFSGFKGFEVNTPYVTKLKHYYIASKKRIYYFGVGSRDVDSPTASRFLKSLQLNGKALFDTSNNVAVNPVEENRVLISEIPETPVDIKTELDLNVGNQTVRTPITSTPPLDTDLNKALVILYKARPAYTDKARHKMETGTIRVRVTFKENGQVSNIVVIKTLKYGLVENATKAARRIRFFPMIVNDKEVDIVKSIEYHFTIY